MRQIRIQTTFPNVRNLTHCLLAAALTIAPLAITALSLPQPTLAQNFTQRTIQGKVFDGDSPAAGATIFLKNLKSRDIKSFTSTSDGSYRFAQVGMIDDYEVWAERAKKKSAVKTVSSFDSRKLLDLDLKLK